MKNLRYIGKSFSVESENEYEVYETKLTPTEIQMPFQDSENERSYLTATSVDGCLYQGSYGRPQFKEAVNATAEVKLFRSENGEVVLVITSRSRDDSAVERWIVELTPSADLNNPDES